ncbi:N-6 DNA methylase [Candidatus Sumerlaeota bacterium]|nr:N-6 DNA methylase [Candidatus Sumerlaeota bacterium]
MPRISENTINDSLTKLYRENGLNVLPQMIILGERQPDHLVEYHGTKIIFETEVGNFPQKICESLRQYVTYNEKLNWNNFVSIIFPDTVRKPIKIVSSVDVLRSIVNRTKARIYYQIAGKRTDIFTGTVPEFLNKLKKIIDQSFVRPEVDINALVNTLSNFTEEFSFLLRKLRLGSEILNTPVGSFELFTSIAEYDPGKLETSITDLLAYIFINQIIFYKIFADRTKKVPPLHAVKTLQELHLFFDKIVNIDYRAIYNIDVLSVIPEKPEILIEINNFIRIINSMPLNEVHHDLLGRFFHDLLPFNTRKILAAFYTRPQSAEILSALAIDNYDEKVIDPACGSGTLLVSAYRRKSMLAPRKTKSLHKQFVENDIYGIDIMPFAVHLTGINLSTQNIQMVTNYTLTAVGDSLLDISRKKLVTFPSKIHQVDTFLSQMIPLEQKTINETDKLRVELHKFDTVIMNPPFTKKERLPKQYRQHLDPYWKEWGRGIGLWGLFLGLAIEYLVKRKGGKIAAVIPIALFRGRESRELRQKLFSPESNIRIRYVVKATRNFAFSESSAYRDILLVLETGTKRKYAGFVFLNTDLRALSINEAAELGERIKAIPEGVDHSNEKFELFWYPHNELYRYQDNLMPFVSVVKSNNRSLLFDLWKQLQNNPFFTKGKEKLIGEAYGPRPRGLNKVIFITRPTEESRVKNAFLIFDGETSSYIKVKIKNSNIDFNVPKNCVLPTLRTVTGLNKMVIGLNDVDFVIVKPFSKIPLIKKYAQFENKIDWGRIKRELLVIKTNSVLVRRFRYNSPNSFLMSYFSEIPIYPTNQFKILRQMKHRKESILFFNSIFFWIQSFLIKEDTTEVFIDIHGHDLSNIYIPDFEKLTKESTKLINDIFKIAGEYHFPSFLQQLEEPDPIRLKIDRTLAEIFGIKVDLPRIYSALAEEIRLNASIR